MRRNSPRKARKQPETTIQSVPKTIQKNSQKIVQVFNLNVNLEGLTKASSLYSLLRRWMKNGNIEEEEELQEEVSIQLAPPTPQDELKLPKLKNIDDNLPVISSTDKKTKRENIETILNSTVQENKVLPEPETLFKNLKEEAVKIRKLRTREFENKLVRYSQRIKSLVDDWDTFDESLALGLHSMKKNDIKKQK